MTGRSALHARGGGAPERPRGEHRAAHRCGVHGVWTGATVTVTGTGDLDRPTFRKVGSQEATAVRVFGPEDRRVGVVVKEAKLPTASRGHRLLGPKHQRDNRAQDWGVGVGATERGLRPVLGSQERAHLTARQECRDGYLSLSHASRLSGHRSCRRQPQLVRLPGGYQDRWAGAAGAVRPARTRLRVGRCRRSQAAQSGRRSA
jgi:hypothetical protein